jgi:hypothetical protein
MKATVNVEFEDLGEAARFLAGYTSKLYENPETAEATRREFPLFSYDTRLSAHIAEAAALKLYESLCTEEGREERRRRVMGK